MLFQNKIIKITEPIIIAQEYKVGDRVVMRYAGFKTPELAAKAICETKDEDKTFHEVFYTSGFFPIIMDYDMKCDGPTEFTEEDYDDYGNDLIAVLEDLCDILDIDKDSIHIESACRPSKISFHVKIYGTSVRLREQPAIIAFMEQKISCELIKIKYFDLSIYNKSGYQHFRLMDNTKLGESCYLRRYHGNRTLAQSFIYNKTRPANYTLVVQDAINENVCLILPGLDSPIIPDNMPSATESVKYKLKERNKDKDDKTGEIIKEIKDTGCIKMGKKGEFVCSIENITTLINHSPNLDDTKDWKSFTKAIKCLDFISKSIYGLYDTRCKQYKGYDADKNAEIYKRTEPFGLSLLKLIWFVHKSGHDVITIGSPFIGSLENDLIDTDLIDRKIKEIGADNIKVALKNKPLSTFMAIYGDNFKLTPTHYAFYNKCNGIWIPCDKAGLMQELEHIVEYITKRVGIKKYCCTKLRNQLVSYCVKKYDHLRMGRSNPFIIPFNNGKCYDAETNIIRSIQYNDFIVRSTNIDINEMGEYGFIDNILRDIIYDDTLKEPDNIKNYNSFKAMIGYCVLGDTRLQQLFILSGNASNGKSLIGTLLDNAMGDMFTIVNKGIIVGQGRDGESPEPEKCKLLTKRLGLITELESGDKWNESFCKSITGELKFSVRALYEEARDVENFCKLLILTNHVPDIGPTPSMKRRMVVVELKKKYCDEKEYEANKQYPNIRKADFNLINKILCNREYLDQLYNYILHCARYFITSKDRRIESNIDISIYNESDSLIDIIKANIERKNDSTITITSVCEILYGAPVGKAYTKAQRDECKACVESIFSIKFAKHSNGMGWRGLGFKNSN